MAFFRRLFGGRGDDSYSRGVSAFEAGHVVESIELLRPVFTQDPGSPRGSLAGFYLRQALVVEGRRLLDLGESESAARVLGEASEHWPDYPDLIFLTGAARGFAGAWDGALTAARDALRRNPDYCEARLLEACALQSLARRREAATSLMSLRESGRRVDHKLLQSLPLADDLDPDQLPSDLVDHLRLAAIGDDAKQRVAEAVALCQAGQWDQGLAEFERLGAAFPRYQDIRAKHAAALYQAGRTDQALAEAEAALALNDRYRTAVSLKGLILAEQGKVSEAQAYLAAAVPRLEGTAGRHEELFLAYLRGVLALLAGDLGDCRRFLDPWSDLPRQFARAELLLAACDDLAGQPGGAVRRLENLCEVWTADAEFLFLRVALLLEQGEGIAAEGLMSRWPTHMGAGQDPRPLLLRARLDVAAGREPTLLAMDDVATDGSPHSAGEPSLHIAAWQQLSAAADLASGAPQEAWSSLQSLLAAGYADEETGRMLLHAAALIDERPPADLAGRIGGADSWAVDLCRQLRNQGSGEAAEAFVQRRWCVRPDRVQWSWLSTVFWLGPVRRWLA